MAKEYIKDFYGKVLGYLETQGTKTIARDFYGKVLGSYDSRDNFTRDVEKHGKQHSWMHI